MDQSQINKKRTTIYIATDVLEFLKIRSAKGRGSVSRQLETLARELMPKEFSPEDIKMLEQQHAQGYKTRPLGKDEFTDFYREQELGAA